MLAGARIKLIAFMMAAEAVMVIVFFSILIFFECVNNFFSFMLLILSIAAQKWVTKKATLFCLANPNQHKAGVVVRIVYLFIRTQ